MADVCNFAMFCDHLYFKYERRQVVSTHLCPRPVPNQFLIVSRYSTGYMFTIRRPPIVTKPDIITCIIQLKWQRLAHILLSEPNLRVNVMSMHHQH